MERSAAQYLVLHDEAILTRYEHQQSKLKQEVNRLLTLSHDPALSKRLQQLLLWQAAALINFIENDREQGDTALIYLKSL